MKTFIKNSLVIFFLFFVSYSFANNLLAKKYQIQGIVVDKTSEAKIEYTTITLFTSGDSSLVAGTITNAAGSFSFEVSNAGNYYIKITFIGFEDYQSNLNITESDNLINLGTINLVTTANNLGEIEITENRKGFEYNIDKKVINVDEMLTSASGSAIDLLENSPSVKVDIEGNISLRGSSNITVLINGVPTILEATDALEQIPASLIKQIEIITNPSAKYNPEGTAGIINIITKKNKLLGLNGMIDLNAGTWNNYGGALLLNYNAEKYRIFLKGNLTNKANPAFTDEESVITNNDTIYYLNSNSDNGNLRQIFSPSVGFEWTPDSANTLNVEFTLGTRQMNNYANINFEEWTSAAEQHLLNTSEEVWGKDIIFGSLNINYKHDFKKEGSNVIFQISGSKRNGDEISNNSLYAQDLQLLSRQKAITSGPNYNIQYRSDYILPLNKNKFEAGFQGELGEGYDDYKVYNYVNNNFEFSDLFSNNIIYQRSITGVYALYSSNLQKIAYQIGLRGEHTYRLIQQIDTGDSVKINRFDYFPTLHFSYQLNKKNQLMASYTRRVNRPHNHFYEPFLTWNDAYNVSKGNPALLPEYIDSWEVNYQTAFGKNALTAEIFYRITNNKIETIRIPYLENIMMQTFENVGNDYSFGSEIILNLTPSKWYLLDLTCNFYQYKIKGELNGNSFDNGKNFNWSSMITNTFKYKKNTKIQIIGNYTSPSVWSQGRKEDIYYLNVAIKQSFMNRALNLTLQARDILGTSKDIIIFEDTNFYTSSVSQKKLPIISLSVSWKFNNYKIKNTFEDSMDGEGF